MNASPRVSVIIPAYNREKLVTEAVDSILAQTFKDYEIIVVDDGSKDATEKVLRDRYGAAVHCIRQENKGLPGARNTGIRAARGGLVALLDSDDLYQPTFLEEAVAFLDAEPELGLVFADTEKFNSSGVIMASFFKGKKLGGVPFRDAGSGRRILERKIFPELVGGNFIPCSAVVARAKCFGEIGLFREDYRFCEDVDMWLRFDAGFRLGYIDRVLARVRVHDGNMTGAQFSEQYFKYRLTITENILKEKRGGTPIEIAAVREALGNLHFSIGWKRFSDNQFAIARGHFLASLRYGKPSLRTLAYFLACCLPGPVVAGLRAGKPRSPAIG